MSSLGQGKSAAIVVVLAALCTLHVEAQTKTVLRPYLENIVAIGGYYDGEAIFSYEAWWEFTVMTPGLCEVEGTVSFAYDSVNTGDIYYLSITRSGISFVKHGAADYRIETCFIPEKTTNGYKLLFYVPSQGNFKPYAYYKDGKGRVIDAENDDMSLVTDDDLTWILPFLDSAEPTTTEAPTTTTEVHVPTTTQAPTTSSASAKYMPTVELRDNEVIVTVNKSRVAHLNVANMFAGDDSTLAKCRGSESGDDIVFSFGLGECNPEINVTDTDDVEFTYMIRTDPDDDTVGAISRTNHGEIEVVCLYPRNAVVNVDYEANRTFATYVGGSDGSFTFSMSLYSDANLTTAYESDAVIPVGTPVYTDIRFENPSADLNMFVQDCVASPEANNSTYAYELIKPGGCFGDDETFAVVEAASKEYTYQFEAFRFTGVGSEEVYLKCNLYVCQASEAEAAPCQHPHACTAPGRRDVNSQEKNTFPISFGPIKVQ